MSGEREALVEATPARMVGLTVVDGGLSIVWDSCDWHTCAELKLFRCVLLGGGRPLSIRLYCQEHAEAFAQHHGLVMPKAWGFSELRWDRLERTDKGLTRAQRHGREHYQRIGAKGGRS